jgi:EF hand domain-containing protein
MMVTHRYLTGSFFLMVIAGVLAASSPAAAQNGRARGREDTQQAGAAAPIRFQSMDADHDGVITRAEWRGSDQVFRQEDTNHDGVLSGTEIAPRPEAEPRGRRRDEIIAQFTRADRDGDRRLRRNEWTLDLGSFEQADTNGDGMVTRLEFLNSRPSGAAASSDTTGSNAGLRRGTPAFQAGFDKGLAEGRQAGKEDRTVNGGKWDLEGQRELEQADSGYEAGLGARVDYQAGYRVGFRRGYAEGFGPR